MSNIHGLSAFREKDEKDDDEDRNERYVGGVDSRGGGSGLAVEPNTDDGVNSGGVPPPPGASRDSVFNLAENAAGPGESGEGDSPPPRRTITMYRDGFVVDNGPYRRLDDPANADFLRSLARGMTPRELMEESQGNGSGGDVTVGLIDKRSEEYVETFQSFSGAGTTLGGATTAVASEGGDTNDSTSTNGIVNPTTLPAPTEVDMSRPTTSIQVRLMNGTKQVIKLNTDRTVLQLAAHLPLTEGNFTLVSGFPPKPLLNLQQTLEEAGLKGAQVVQKKA
mmetsp:Transcript_16693/g.25909  ORF Transcript_16693/g.25909 Transcript_16693/m.25909 type:complete len:279 (-) Transcript_16693:210-1046(-)